MQTTDYQAHNTGSATTDWVPCRWVSIAILVVGVTMVLPGMVQAQNYSINGTVRGLERTTGASIENVFVDVDSSKYVAQTDANGNFILNNIPAGAHNIRMSAPGYIGILKQNYNLDGNKTLNVCLADTMQESPNGELKLELDQYRSKPPWEPMYTALHYVDEGYPNGSTWNGITEGNLIPIKIVNATPQDSAYLKAAIGNCNGDWENSPDGSAEKEQKRNLFTFSDAPGIGYTSRGIVVNFNTPYTNTQIFAYEENNYYNYAAEVNLADNMPTTIQKEIMGRSFSKGDIAGRLSYMNATSSGMTDLDDMLNIVFFNQWAAIGRGEQNANILDMENSPIYNAPTTPSITSPQNNATDLAKLVNFACENKFGAKSYRWQIATDEAFNDIITEANVSRIDTAMNMPGHKTLYARVRAESDKGNSEYSTPIQLSIINSAPTKPVITLPTGTEAINPSEGLAIEYTQSTDSDNDPVTYNIRIWNAVKDTTIVGIDNTAYMLPAGVLKTDSNYSIKVTATDGELSTESTTKTFNTITGIEDIIESTDYSIYPNPCAREAHIEYTTKQDVKIKTRVYDITGAIKTEIPEQTVYSGITYTENISFDNYPTGLYLLSTQITNTSGRVYFLSKRISRE